MTALFAREALAKKHRTLPAFDNGSGAITAQINADKKKIGADQGTVHQENAAIARDNAETAHLRALLRQLNGADDPAIKKDIQAQIAAEKAKIAAAQAAKTAASGDIKAQNAQISADNRTLSNLKTDPALINSTALQNYGTQVGQEKTSAQADLKTAQGDLSLAQKKLSADQHAINQDVGQIAQLKKILGQLNSSDDPSIKAAVEKQIAAVQADLKAKKADRSTENAAIQADKAAIDEQRQNILADSAAAKDLGKLSGVQSQILADKAKSAGLSGDKSKAMVALQQVDADKGAIYGARLYEEATRGTPQHDAAVAALRQAQAALKSDQAALDAANDAVKSDQQAAAQAARDMRGLYQLEQNTNATASQVISDQVVGTVQDAGGGGATGSGDGAVNLGGAPGGPTGVAMIPN